MCVHFDVTTDFGFIVEKFTVHSVTYFQVVVDTPVFSRCLLHTTLHKCSARGNAKLGMKNSFSLTILRLFAKPGLTGLNVLNADRKNSCLCLTFL